MKRLIRKIKTVTTNPKSILVKTLYFSSPMFGDEMYLKILYHLRLMKKLNLKNPITYNEKLQWLKLNYRKPVMTKMVDKFEAKKWIRQIVGEEYVIKNYGIWNQFDEIDFNILPNQFVLKTTHDQGGVVICKDKDIFDLKEAKKKLDKHLKIKHYLISREWPYKDVKPRILAEEYLNSNNDLNFKDYKFYCFNGEPKVMYISMGKVAGKMTLDYYDMNFNKLNIRRPGIENSGCSNIKPQNWDLMIDLSRRLSMGFPHIRIDFYEINNKTYVGELTFFQGGGLMRFIPEEWDKIFGDWIEIDSLSNKN